MPVTTPLLVLASASPRRAQLLEQAGYSFTVDAADVDESVLRDEAAADYVLRVARAKARVVADRRWAGSVVLLAADTTVVVDGAILAKPEDAADAVRMLTALAGRLHDVLTGVVVIAGAREVSEVVLTRVRFLPMTAGEIAWYVGTGEAQGKAGAYGIQGRAARFIDWLEGSWSNVVGLPVATVAQLLKKVGA
ncbi:MAG: Maf family protein [Vicinamibacterales bacterium]